MVVDIREPELETLIQKRMSSGRYKDVQDVLLWALRSPEVAIPAPERQGDLRSLFDKVRGLADDLDISRDRSPSRDVDLS